MEIIQSEAFGRVWLTSIGLRARGQSEVAVPLTTGSAGESRNAEGVLRMLDRYGSDEGRRIRADETMAYGIDCVRLRTANDFERARLTTDLVVQESSEPLAGRDTFVDGMRTLSAIDDQWQATLDRLGFDSGCWTNRSRFAVVCKHFGRGTSYMMEREEPEPDLEDSGWGFACGDAEHDEDPANSQLIHVAHAIEMRPEIVPYLIVPYGKSCRVDVIRGQIFVFPPGASQPIVEPLAR